MIEEIKQIERRIGILDVGKEAGMQMNIHQQLYYNDISYLLEHNKALVEALEKVSLVVSSAVSGMTLHTDIYAVQLNVKELINHLWEISTLTDAALTTYKGEKT